MSYGGMQNRKVTDASMLFLGLSTVYLLRRNLANISLVENVCRFTAKKEEMPKKHKVHIVIIVCN